MKTRTISFLIVLIVTVNCLFPQNQRQNRDSLFISQDSRNGYILPVHGQIHILVIFAEVIYDTGNDPCPAGGNTDWPSGKLPVWKNKLFDPYPTQEPKGKVTSFFHESSFGNYIVTGDYLINPDFPDKPVQIKASDKVSMTSVVNKASEFSEFKTAHNFSIQDFDKWTMTHVGHEKITPGTDSPPMYEHVMIIIRNSIYPSNLSGWTSSRSPGRLFGIESDTYSFFCTHELLPFNILLHEFSHMLFGGNNFHAGGSHSKKAGYSYFPHIQGGWGMMGAAWKSFLTTNAWERRRLGWKPDNKQFYISTLDSVGKVEALADLDPFNPSHAGVYLIRDFVTTGDAIRIKLPYISEKEFQQWIWIENHQTSAFNRSEFDKFQYQYAECIDNATPGLYIYLQVDKEDLTGRSIFEGHADYLRPLPANGLWDFEWGDSTVQNPWCINNNMYFPHEMKTGRENPFSGSHEMELVFGDYNSNGKIEIEEYRVPAIRNEGRNYLSKLPVLGAKEHAFVNNGNNHLGIGTNPSTSSLITTVTAGNELYPGRAPNNRTVYLNGISIQIIDKPSPVNGAIYVKIRFDDYHIRKSTRWCADTIILPASDALHPIVLSVEQKNTLHIDRGITPTRISIPDTIQKQFIYTKPTVFIIGNKSTLHVRQKSILKISNGSVVIFGEGSVLKMYKKSTLILSGGSRLIMGKGAVFIQEKGAKIKVSANSEIICQ